MKEFSEIKQRSNSVMAGIMNDNGIHSMQYSGEQEMQCEDSTIDDSSIHPTAYSAQSSDWNGQQNNYSSSVSMSKSHGKGSKKVKSEDPDEDIDIDNYVQQDVQRIPVKTLRKVIPKLRIAVYCSELMTSGKRKLKHLWDERPSDWPQTVPFKDPNNACKEVKKPGKDELGPMFNFLKNKYLQNQGSHHTAMTYSSEQDFSFNHPVTTESSDDKDAAFYSSVSSNPILPHIPLDQQNNGFTVNPKTEPTAYIDISELMKPEKQFNITSSMVSVEHQAPMVSIGIASKPQPVTDLFYRLEKKSRDVIHLSTADNHEPVIRMLREVQLVVINKLYDDITPSDTRICLMFLDAGHQMEALLDVMLVLGQVDVHLLQNGCQEIIKKFNTQNVNFVLCPDFTTNLGMKDQPSAAPMISFKNNSVNSLFFSSKCDDTNDNSLNSLLGLNLLDTKKEGRSFETVPTSHAPLYKPRHGAVLENSSEMGIQTRRVAPSSPERASKSGLVPVKGMFVVSDTSPPPVKLSEQEQVNEIMKELTKDAEMMIDDQSKKLFYADGLHGTKNMFDLEDLNCDTFFEDLNNIIDADYIDQQPQSVGSSSSEFSSASEGQMWPMEVAQTTPDQQQHQDNNNFTAFQSFCQETMGRGGWDPHSQLLPSSSASAKNVIPSMVESLTCADSENEDSDNSFLGRPQRHGRGGMGTAGGGGGGFTSAKVFDGGRCHW